MSPVTWRVTAETVDNSNLMKALVIKAEDPRIVGDTKLMKRYYADFLALINELGSIDQAVQQPQKELLNALKAVNQTI
jgi:hypothetical protein